MRYELEQLILISLVVADESMYVVLRVGGTEWTKYNRENQHAFQSEDQTLVVLVICGHDNQCSIRTASMVVHNVLLIVLSGEIPVMLNTYLGI